MQPPEHITSLGRPVDPAWSTNRAIAILTALVAGGGFLAWRWTGTPFLSALLSAVFLAIAFFLGWALARELDPDHDLSAFPAAGLALPAAIVLGRPDFAGVLLCLLILRVVNRSVGPAARIFDTLAILGLVGVAAWRGHALLAAGAAVGLALDAWLQPPHRSHLASAGAALALAGVGFARAAGGGASGIDTLTWAALAATLPFLLLVRGSGQPVTAPDRGGPALSGARVRACQILGLAVLLATAVWEGRAGLAALSPLWAGIVGTGLYFSIGAPTRLPHSVHDPS